jgi:hypothetical protein
MNVAASTNRVSHRGGDKQRGGQGEPSDQCSFHHRPLFTVLVTGRNPSTA